MPLFDAVCHSLSTLSTGGFSTRNHGIAEFSSPFIRVIITIFMFIAGTNLALFYFAAKGNFRKIIRNNEFVFYSFLAFGISLLIAFLLISDTGVQFPRAMSDGFFNTISIMTTTGFYTENFNQWGNLSVIIIFILMFTGGNGRLGKRRNKDNTANDRCKECP